MKQMVPLEKQSKKQQKAFYAAQRGSWNGVVPSPGLFQVKSITTGSGQSIGEMKMLCPFYTVVPAG